MATVVNNQVAGLLAAAIAAQTVKKLVDNGALSKQDAYDIYGSALGNLGSASEQADAKILLQGLMPGLIIP